MTEEELCLLIPSSTVRRQIRETDWPLSDFTMAALTCRADLTLKEKYIRLGEIMGRTTDTLLHEQIAQWRERKEGLWECLRQPGGDGSGNSGSLTGRYLPIADFSPILPLPMPMGKQ